MPESSKQSRQLPGNACDECRRRKLRCDRKRPRCGSCANNPNIPCNITEERVPRGPKKGSISAIRSRIVALERRLSEPSVNSGNTTNISSLPDQRSGYPENTLSMDSSNLSAGQLVDQGHSWDSSHSYHDYPASYSHYDPNTTQSPEFYTTTAFPVDNYSYSTTNVPYTTSPGTADVDWGHPASYGAGNTYYYMSQP